MFLVLGVLFLLRDFNVWNFWNVSWWSAVLVVYGITVLAQRSCGDCQACMGCGPSASMAMKKK
jgi:hypothetical protein